MAFTKLIPARGCRLPRSAPGISVKKTGKHNAYLTQFAIPKRIMADAGLDADQRLDLYVGEGPDRGWVAIAPGDTYTPSHSETAHTIRFNSGAFPAGATMPFKDVEYRVSNGLVALKLPKGFPLRPTSPAESLAAE